MTLDLRGHGASKTKNQRPIVADRQWRTSPHEFPVDIDPTLDWLKGQTRIDSGKIVVIGYDVGANLALIAAGKFPEVRTVVAVEPLLDESFAMAGSAQDFQPRSALIVVSNETEGNRIRGYVQKPVQVLNVSVAGGTAQSFADRRLTDAVFQWLKETF
jgi:pimeloyl-ACP methyl ester carboxylesterase